MTGLLKHTTLTDIDTNRVTLSNGTLHSFGENDIKWRIIIYLYKYFSVEWAMSDYK